ncbi:alpha/beta hydrolase fold-domain-containing protein [Absidia repens]|uniref:Alpha/beta hydrolase fold-domain-containing protein n=1 Tax=Absidia repens TaxID=90262 RepID=A0A1X2I0V0_9FUNG|nr:alpha/beta hydrolase fold-domain-containing protein [Absidia repens]
MTKLATATAAPAAPAYAKMIAEMNAAGFSLRSTPLLDLRAYGNLPVPLPGGVAMPQTAPVEEKIIPTDAENGTGTVTLTVLRPVGTENEILPVAIYLHGGAWCVGSLMNTEKFVKDVVVKANTVVIYVEYSLSPEVKFPVALEEIYSSILWVKENAASINVDPSKISVFGDSAGGALTASVAILLKQRGHSDVMKNQILIYPAVAHNHDQYESVSLYGKGDYILSYDDMIYVSKLYHDSKYNKMNDDGGWCYGPENVLNAPLLARKDELEDLPRCLVVTAECDVLRDESEHYARQLTAAGVDTCAVRFIGAVHGFITKTDLDTPQYRQGVQAIVDFLKE